jgi:hypothetical protein
MFDPSLIKRRETYAVLAVAERRDRWSGGLMIVAGLYVRGQ